MAYSLEAVVGSGELLRAAVRGIPEARLAPLGQGLVVMPITEELFDAVSNGAESEVGGFWRLPGGFGANLAVWSEQGPVAYVEAEYFGGTGQQSAAVWLGGAIVLGPLTWCDGEPRPGLGSPMSQALRMLGVVAATGEDEFSTAGMRRHRQSEHWVRPGES